jgi:hypothetical protein
MSAGLSPLMVMVSGVEGAELCATDSGRGECIGPQWATHQTNKTPGRNRGLFISEEALLLLGVELIVGKTVGQQG